MKFLYYYSFAALIGLFSVLFVVECIASCEAPEILGDHRWWGTHPEPLYIISTLNMPNYLNTNGVINHMQAAAASWSASTYYFDFQENGTNQEPVDPDIPCAQQTYLNNLLGWSDLEPLWIRSWDNTLTGLLGETLVCTTGQQGASGRWLIDFVHAGLNYAIDDGSGSYKWSLDPDPPEPGDYQFDVQSVAAHELGHWLNLDHTPLGKYSSWPTMEIAKYDLRDEAGETDRRSLECEDQWGISQIYDGSSSAPPIFVPDVPHQTNRRHPNLMSVPRISLLHQNVPNPANPETWMPFELSQDAEVVIRIYNSEGFLIRTLDLGHQAAGFYTSRDKAAYWDGRNAAGESVASGVYYYHLGAGEFSATRKMLIVK